MNIETQIYAKSPAEFVTDEIEELEHELALARASSDYWREKYIEAAPKPKKQEWEMDIVNGRVWYRRLDWNERNPMDDCDE